ncbi:unnamed protein product [Sphagnum jensenii]|uniref:DNA polymerase III gamma subunit domain-containing protein n=1 Tax=Sphagnum jensenii TaxID=128206 RepID=A0ABP1BU15_9BRYO
MQTNSSSYNRAKGTPEAPKIIDGLEVSEIPQQGCSRPWYESHLQKSKGKRLLDSAGMGFTCAFPESMKRKDDLKQVSRNGSQLGSLWHHEAAAAGSAVTPDQLTLLSLDSSTTEAPLVHGKESLLNGEEYLHDDDIDICGHSGIEKSSSVCDWPSDYGLTLVRARAGNPRSMLKLCLSEQYDSVGGTPHRSLSQKYRPKCFKDLMGQSLVVKSLTTAITKGKIAPEYLFVGPDGTDKKTTAIIFAEALICHNTEPHCQPCGLCRECATFTLNRSSNVKEIDVASNLEVDGMRTVLHRMTFSPFSSRYRVPKAPFGKVKEVEIVTQLQSLATKDELEVEEAALSLIAARANGSLHDAERMLDQLSLWDRKVSLAMVQELVGLVLDNKLLELLDLALSADTANTLFQAHGTLISLCIAKDNSYVVSHVEFQNPENNAKARRLQSSTCHAFQIALGCPVELKLSLAHPPAIVTEEAWLHHRKQMLVENQQHLENLIGHTAVNPDGVEEYQTGSNRGNDCYLGLKNPDEVPQDLVEVLTWEKLGWKDSDEISMPSQPNGPLHKLDENHNHRNKLDKAAKRKKFEFKGIITIEQESLKNCHHASNPPGIPNAGSHLHLKSLRSWTSSKMGNRSY